MCFVVKPPAKTRMNKAGPSSVEPGSFLISLSRNACHPDHNRVPTDEESANCRPFLDLQLKVINPKVIVCLGATAAQNLLKTKEAVSKLRNAWYNYNTGTVNAKVRVTFHPAYLLRNPAEKTKVWDDMQAVLAELKNGT